MLFYMPFYMKKVFNLVSEIYLYRVIERMAKDWARVEPKLYTDMSPYPRGCAWNRENCILAIRLIRFFAKQ